MCSSVVFFAIVSATTNTLAEDEPGVSTGRKIGNAISTAITVAFPQVQTLVDLIFGKDASPKSEVKKIDAEDNLKKELAGLQTKVAEQLKLIDKVGKDLSTLRSFLRYCVEAQVKVASMQAVLASFPTPDESKRNELTYAWNEAASRLKKLGSDFGAQIDAMDDQYAKAVLRAVAAANLGTLDNINLQVNKADWANLRIYLADLEPKLAAANSLAGEVIADLSVGLSATSAKVQGAQGANADVKAAEDSQSFRKVVTRAFPEIK
jgi:phage terminase small subunit